MPSGTDRRRDWYQSWGKRAFDVCVAGVLLLMAAPLLVAVALLIRLRMGPPVLFRQARPGLHGRLFTLMKFRTMHDAVGPDGTPLDDAARLPPLGRRLRAWSLDEVPELWHVVRGQMSLVGPRPLLPEYLPLYSRRQTTRHDVRPGLTGLAQVSGRNALDWDTRLELDAAYVERLSWRLDAWILIRTVSLVLRGTGVTQAGHATVDKFRGKE